MPQRPDDPMVSVEWLAERLDAPDVRIVDGTLFPPGDARDARAGFEAGHIPGAQFFDVEEISDLTSALPHMAPAPDKFAARVKALGIGDGSRVVVYDQLGLFSAARVWWLFRLMGKQDAVVLDGGLPAFLAGGHELETGPARAAQPRHFTARRRGDLVRSFEEMVGLVGSGGGAQIVDARPAGRFAGAAPEPREGLRGGHMPGAISVPHSTLLEADGRLKSKDGLRAAFAAAGVEAGRETVCTCGSGVTAAVIALALARMGNWSAAVYDGSWAEWGARADTPVSTQVEGA